MTQIQGVISPTLPIKRRKKPAQSAIVFNIPYALFVLTLNTFYHLYQPEVNCNIVYKAILILYMWRSSRSNMGGRGSMAA